MDTTLAEDWHESASQLSHERMVTTQAEPMVTTHAEDEHEVSEERTHIVFRYSILWKAITSNAEDYPSLVDKEVIQLLCGPHFRSAVTEGDLRLNTKFPTYWQRKEILRKAFDSIFRLLSYRVRDPF
ncbi:hypothetical protein N0V83_008175 [Neocucurbitaria cava]|uniref:Uncharacterized protein n=1 Tax=Neocucurbitaria cava TaxID=798079 RepID=A0A9W9CJA9_9PLEO|nr:hypothetical protein N0V83_008175 [Neocucurbitaria cava]